MRKIHEVITEETWCKDIARDKDNNVVDAFSREACKWCLYGWISKIYGAYGAYQLSGNITHKVINALGKPIGAWNDASERTFQDVLELCIRLDI